MLFFLGSVLFLVVGLPLLFFMLGEGEAYVTWAGLTHQCLYFEQPHTFEQILFIQTAEPALVGHA